MEVKSQIFACEVGLSVRSKACASPCEPGPPTVVRSANVGVDSRPQTSTNGRMRNLSMSDSPSLDMRERALDFWATAAPRVIPKPSMLTPAVSMAARSILINIRVH